MCLLYANPWEKGSWLQEERAWQEVGHRADWDRVQGTGGGMLGDGERGRFLSQLLVLCHFPTAQVLGSLLPIVRDCLSSLSRLKSGLMEVSH